MSNYYQKEIETASREEILKIQNEKIVKQVKHVYENVPYYRNLMDQKGVMTSKSFLSSPKTTCAKHIPTDFWAPTSRTVSASNPPPERPASAS